MAVTRALLICSSVALSIVAPVHPLLAAPPVREAAGDETNGIAEEQQNRELNGLRFLHDHADSSGFVRPDLWRIGMEHARRMEVVRNIGEDASRSRSKPPYKEQKSP